MADLPACLCAAVLAIFLSIGVVQAGQYCYEKHYSSVTYCSNGCCGTAGSQYCCDWSPTVALVVGCVFAGLFVISVLVVIICCCIKKNAHSGKVVSPAPGSLQTRPGPGITTATATPATVTTTTTATHINAYQMSGFFPGTGAYHPPPAYNAHHVPPLTQPPAYQSPAPPPAYDLYGRPAAPQEQQPATYAYGQGGGGGGGSSSTGASTTAYGNNFIV